MTRGRFCGMPSLQSSTFSFISSLRNGGLWIIVIFSVFSSTSAAAFQTDIQKEMHGKQVMIRGLTFLRTGFPDKAVAVFDEGLKINPNDPTILSSMADAQFALGDFGLANFYIDRALAVEPNNIDLNRQAFMLALESGDAKRAIDLSSLILELNPTDISSHLAHLELLQRLQQRDLVMTSAVAAQQLFKDQEIVQRAALRLFLDLGSLELARVTSEALVDLTSDPDDLYELASIYIRLDSIDLAKIALNGVIAQDPYHDVAIASLESLSSDPAAEERFFGQTPASGTAEIKPTLATGPDSLAVLVAASSGNPTDAQASERLAAYLFDHQRFEELITLSADQIEADPKRLSMWIFLLKSHIANNNFESAITIAQDGVSLFPGYAPLLFQYAVALSNLDRFEEALDVVENALPGADSDPTTKAQLEKLKADLIQHQ